MLQRFSSILTASALAIAPVWAAAQDAQDTQSALFEALGLEQMLEVMREEGIAYGQEIGADLFQDGNDSQWMAIVSQIYDVDAMTQEVTRQLAAELEGDDIDAMLAFFTAEPGRTIVSLEVSARRALLDDAVEEASKEAAALAMMDETERYKLVRRYIDANDLIETNVVGAMNSNYAFYLGMMEGGALPSELTEEQILTDVWGQEPDIRANTTEWVVSFLMMAYQPLPDADLEAYIAFSQTEAGKDLNAALFASFDGMFDNISHALGFASSQFMVGQDI